MWSRVELKTQAKNLLKLNYWMFVLGGIILSIVTAGNVSGVGRTNFNFGKKDVDYNSVSKGFGGVFSNGDATSGSLNDSINSIAKNITPSVARAISAVIIGGIIIALVVVIVSIAVSVFVFNPIEVGAKRFFSRSYEAKCDMREITYAFKSNYLNVIKIMFFKNLFTFLWTLLFIVPGIIKRYEYSMIPYILSENPDIDMQKAFEESKRLTDGQKWQMFVLDLSFIGWGILGTLTFGLLGIFFVSPYSYLTKAGLYRRLRGYNDYKY